MNTYTAEKLPNHDEDAAIEPPVAAATAFHYAISQFWTQVQILVWLTKY